MSKNRKFIEVKGIVQGVGFRPFVYKLAKLNNLFGWVNNTSKGVFIDIEGDENNINNFINELKYNAPPLSRITSININNMELLGYENFIIKESINNLNATTYISPDYSTCSECKNEIFDKNNRRYRYPFTNCTNCGPRFSIIKSLPYDRVSTTMNYFEMCDNCKQEYTSPDNRRFHAQPNACPKCGPSVYIIDKHRNKIQCDDYFIKAINLLKEGNIFAIKGIGGFNLVCNSKNEQAIKTLRERKNRPKKPLAVMMKDIETVKKYCVLDNLQEEVLKSNKRPIVLLYKKGENIFPQNLSPNNKKVGVMLPYTPLHYLLFDDELDSLVMTSANISGEPIIYKNDDAIKKLNNIVDYFFMHNRDIYISIDDSVSNITLGKERVIRNGRGYFPYTLNINIFISQYIGDLKNTETIDSFEKTIKHFRKIYDVTPEVLVYDKHPSFEYRNIDLKNILNINKDIKIIEVQNHHSHIVSCMAENNINEKVIGIAFDGTGYGEDKNIWGGEFLICTKSNFKRIGHLDEFYLPGGDKAIKEPWRIGISLIYKIFNDEFNNFVPNNLKDKKYNIIRNMIDKKINCPRTSSMGRLFDGVSSILGLIDEITFEGEAAITLENICDEKEGESYKFEIKKDEEKFILDFNKIIKGIIYDVKGLEKYKFKVLTNKIIPCNDSGVSLGQLIIANELLKEELEGSNYVHSCSSKN